MKNELEELFTDSSPFNESEIVSLIKPFVTIQKNNFDIFLYNIDKFSADDKILLYILAKKILKFKKYIPEETISALEFHKKTGIKKGTVDPAFKNLNESGLLVGSKDTYEIPNIKIPEIIKRLKNKI